MFRPMLYDHSILLAGLPVISNIASDHSFHARQSAIKLTYLNQLKACIYCTNRIARPQDTGKRAALTRATER